jgi:hypothetical protein
VLHVDNGGDNDQPNHQPFVATADDQGYLTTNWEIPLDGDEGGANLKLTADGQISGSHAEVLFTDLTGTVNLYPEVGRTNSQNAFQWDETVYPRITSAGANTCYRLTWTDPSAAVTKTYYQTSAAGNADPAGIAVNHASGTWTLVVDQHAAGNCDSAHDTGFSSAVSPIFFDVARRVIIGSGTSTTTDAASAGGDQCVYQTNNVGTICQNAASPTMFVRSATSDSIRSYVKFDLTTASPAIPAGVIVNSAKVRLVVAGTISSRNYTIRRASAAWAEGTITWANQPGVTGVADTVPMASALVPGTGGGDPQTWVKWNVTNNVQGFLDGSQDNHGWRISDHGASVAAQGRFNTTESTDGCAAGVTTCKRKWPVLLIDYSDPPKLVFYTTAKIGVVGACLGPIQVQSRQFDGTTPLPVGSNLTVNLSTANLGVGDTFGTAGAGAFYSASDCSGSETTTTTIQTGESVSDAFYYRATDRGDGGHDVVASATGYTPDPSQTETINKAVTVTTYTGDLIVITGSTFTYRAVLSSTYDKCVYDSRGGSSTPYGRRVLFVIDPDPTDGSGTLSSGFKFTNSSGVASGTYATTGWIEGMYDLTANAIGNDNCTAQKAVPDPVIAVLAPGNAATGGGFLAGGKVDGGRANFGFNVRPIEGSDPVAYKGQFLLIRQDGGVPSFRCKGPLTIYGVVSGSTPLQNYARGTCDFQVWNPTLNGGEGDWEVPAGAYTNLPFTISFIDNGTGTKGKLAPAPDEFGFSISFPAGPDNPSFDQGTLNGGNIDVKTGGSTTTTTTSGGGKGKK